MQCIYVCMVFFLLIWSKCQMLWYFCTMYEKCKISVFSYVSVIITTQHSLNRHATVRSWAEHQPCLLIGVFQCQVILTAMCLCMFSVLSLCVLIWGDKLVSTFLTNGKANKFRPVLLFYLSLSPCIPAFMFIMLHHPTSSQLSHYDYMLPSSVLVVYGTPSLSSSISVWKHTHTYTLFHFAHCRRNFMPG